MGGSGERSAAKQSPLHAGSGTTGGRTGGTAVRRDEKLDLLGHVHEDDAAAFRMDGMDVLGGGVEVVARDDGDAFGISVFAQEPPDGPTGVGWPKRRSDRGPAKWKQARTVMPASRNAELKVAVQYSGG